MENEEDVETLEEMESDYEPLEDSEQIVSEEVVSQPSRRQQVDQVLDGTGSQALQKMGVPKVVADQAIKKNGGTFSPTNLPASKMTKNISRNALANNPAFQNKNGSDVNRLQQALNKNHHNLPNFHNQQSDNQNEGEGIGKKLDKVGEKSVEKFGGAAITALSGGAISGKAADTVAKAVAKPAGKMLKYSLLVTFLPLFFIVFFAFSIFIAISSGDVSEANSSNGTQSTPGAGACTYRISKDKTISGDVKVRLLQCRDGQEGKPIEGEELVDFEKYILGVVYAETEGASKEAAKAQAIAARTYSLARTNPAGETGPVKQKDGTWVISLRNCTSTHVYCDPDKGCTVKNGGTAQTSNTVYSGKIPGKKQYKGPMAADHPFRQYIAETAGQVALRKNGTLAWTDYCQSEQDLFDKYAKEGNDAFEVLKKTYNGSFCSLNNHTREKFYSIESNCTEINTGVDEGSFKNWKQCNSSWSNIIIAGKSSICKIGCAATSVAIQIANSGTNVNISKFNPGTFVQAMKKNGGFTAGGEIVWGQVTTIAPHFKFIGAGTLSGSKANKAKQLQKYLNNNEYIVIGVHKDANSKQYGHWVALDKVSGNEVLIFDPGQSSTNKLFQVYPYTVSRPIAIKRFKVS